jgi:hypothetical protein
MFYSSLSHQAATTYTTRKAHDEFERLHHQGLRCQLWSHLTGRGRGLLNLDEVQKQITVQTRSHAGLRLVPIQQIRGSEGRSSDFDADFRPLKRHNQERWMRIALARQLDVPLPLVELVQINDVYFVRDGHHRISVAKALGQAEIEAEVTVWHCREACKVIRSQEALAQVATANQRRSNLGDRLLMSAGALLVATGYKLQALAQVEPTMAAVQGS